MKKFLNMALVAAAPLMFSADVAVAKSKKNQRPPDSFQGQWYVTPAGCSYSRAQAPGYPPQWYLIVNPHHLGQPPAKRSCPRVL